MLRLRKIYAAVDCPLYGEGYPIDECRLCEYFSGLAIELVSVEEL